MSVGQLILTPVDPYQLPDAEAIHNLLLELKFIAAPITARVDQYFAGEQFMQLITFAGCSPFLRFEPNSLEDEEYCHIRLVQWEPSNPRFLFGDNTRPPACPHCRKGITQWSTLFGDLPWAESSAHCPHCGEKLAMTSLNWRKHAGFGRFLLEIHNVFPGEAVPTPPLLASLRNQSHCDWHYFYIRR